MLLFKTHSFLSSLSSQHNENKNTQAKPAKTSSIKIKMKRRFTEHTLGGRRGSGDVRLWWWFDRKGWHDLQVLLGVRWPRWWWGWPRFGCGFQRIGHVIVMAGVSRLKGCAGYYCDDGGHFVSMMWTRRCMRGDRDSSTQW